MSDFDTIEVKDDIRLQIMDNFDTNRFTYRDAENITIEELPEGFVTRPNKDI